MYRFRKSLLILIVLLLPLEIDARIISYAPVTSKFTRPALQDRNNSHYVLLESSDPFEVPSPFPGGMVEQLRGSLVLHDRYGVDEPRVIFRRDAPEDRVESVAVNETSDGRRHILVAANETSGTIGPVRHFYSGDDGETWTTLSLPLDRVIPEFFREDIGGPFVRGRGAQIRLGSSETPFVFATTTRTWPRLDTIIYAVDASGEVRTLLELEAGSNAFLIGSDRQRERFLVTGNPLINGTAKPSGIRILEADGTLHEVLITDIPHPYIEGWITGDSSVYLEETAPANFSGMLVQQKISLVREGQKETILSEGPRVNNGPWLFAVPSHDWEEAWIVWRRGTGEPTSLHRHGRATGLEEMWRDISGPEVEAVHPARSGERLLIQVHRPRAADMRVIVDPALGIWEIGDPAPTRYDELFLAEGPPKGFVSLDVDEAAEGGAFVFDSAPTESLPPPEFSSAPGGGDISQEWGVVRASLHQRLVLPALARLPGRYGSFWKSDVTFLNGESSPVEVELRFTPTASGQSFHETMVLEGNELRLVEDALLELFGMEEGGGALFITPAPGRAIAVTSRTYSESADGTFGMGVGAVDLFAASSARFFHTFAGAFQGPSSRTNLLVTDAGGRGARFGVKASGPTGTTGVTDLAFDVPPAGQIQINDVADWIGVTHQGAARFETYAGQTISTLVSIDNRTNDPTLFPPDVVSGVTRVIPMIGHLDGANGSRFRTDLFLYNTADVVKSIHLRTKSLSVDEQEQWISFTLLPYESKVIPDVYKTAFNREGLGRLRFESAMGDSEGIRVSARIYTEQEDGGTYGFVMPALNGFQAAGSGESLEIIGAVVDPRFRTNLALVDTFGAANGQMQRVRVEILGSGREPLDQFETTVRNAGGTHLVNLFAERGIEAGAPLPVIIRVSPLDGGVIGAFATMIDNRTNDPTYLGAGLASQ